MLCLRFVVISCNSTCCYTTAGCHLTFKLIIIIIIILLLLFYYYFILLLENLLVVMHVCDMS